MPRPSHRHMPSSVPLRHGTINSEPTGPCSSMAPRPHDGAAATISSDGHGFPFGRRDPSAAPSLYASRRRFQVRFASASKIDRSSESRWPKMEPPNFLRFVAADGRMKLWPSGVGTRPYCGGGGGACGRMGACCGWSCIPPACGGGGLIIIMPCGQTLY